MGEEKNGTCYLQWFGRVGPSRGFLLLGPCDTHSWASACPSRSRKWEARLRAPWHSVPTKQSWDRNPEGGVWEGQAKGYLSWWTYFLRGSHLLIINQRSPGPWQHVLHKWHLPSTVPASLSCRQASFRDKLHLTQHTTGGCEWVAPDQGWRPWHNLDFPCEGLRITSGRVCLSVLLVSLSRSIHTHINSLDEKILLNSLAS